MSHINRAQSHAANQQNAQVPNHTDDGVTNLLDTFEVPAYNKGPKLRFEQLDDDQKRVVDLATLNRKNICCVGGAGTGKSETCEIIVDEFTKTRVRVAIVAPTGTAAVNVHGQTLHSFFGMGSNTNKGIDKFVQSMKPTVRERIDKTDVLIIDEISMVTYEAFDRMDRLARAARNEPEKPFGGMQLIVFGDFCQLPPVKPHEHCFQCGCKRKLVSLPRRKKGEQQPRVWRCPENKDHGDVPEGDKMWAFKSTAWRNMGFVDIELTHIHRQHDPTFLALLANVRYGMPFTPDEVDLLMNHECDVTNAVKLASTRDVADKTNKKRLNNLPGIEYKYKCQDDFIWQRDLHPELNEIKPLKRKPNVSSGNFEHPYQETVRLKQGQPVILQKNLDVPRGLVNGSQGIIHHFVDYDSAQQQRQSATDDERISRLRSEQLEDFIDLQNHGDYGVQLPVVKFNNQKDLITIYPDSSVEELGFRIPHSLLIRTQIPLLAGWALTIHKAQGMTLEKATVKLGKCWTGGMQYVALSRVKTLSGLKVKDLSLTEMVRPLDDDVKTLLQMHFQANFD